MKHGLLIGGAILGGLVVLALGDTSVEHDTNNIGYPVTKRLVYVPGPNPGVVEPHFDGKPLPPAATDERTLVIYREYITEARTEWARRRQTLPPEARGRLFIDEYSHGLYWVPAYLVPQFGGLAGLADSITHEITGVLVDDYGRIKPGHYGISQSLWDKTIGNLLKTPAGQLALWAAAMYFGPAGLTVYGAYTLWQAQGADLSVKDVALTAARAALVSECGPACGIAFDMGAGVLQGKSIDDAAEDALIASLTPEQRQAYEQGKALYKQVTV